MAILNRDTMFCICDDVKDTVNPALDVNQHPIPKPKECLLPWLVVSVSAPLDLMQV